MKRSISNGLTSIPGKMIKNWNILDQKQGW